MQSYCSRSEEGLVALDPFDVFQQLWHLPQFVDCPKCRVAQEQLEHGMVLLHQWLEYELHLFDLEMVTVVADVALSSKVQFVKEVLDDVDVAHDTGDLERVDILRCNNFQTLDNGFTRWSSDGVDVNPKTVIMVKVPKPLLSHQSPVIFCWADPFYLFEVVFRHGLHQLLNRFLYLASLFIPPDEVFYESLVRLSEFVGNPLKLICGKLLNHFLR